MTHPHDLLSAHLDGELAPEELTAVVDHLYECATCRRELEELSEVRAMLRDLPLLEAPTPLLAAARRRPTWRVAASSVAAGALAFGLVFASADAAPPELDAMAGQHSARVVVSPGISSVRGLGGAP